MNLLDKEELSENTRNEIREFLLNRKFCDSIFGCWSMRVGKILYNENIHYIKDLVKWSAKELLLLRGFGPACLEEVEDFLNTIGLALRKETDE